MEPLQQKHGNQSCPNLDVNRIRAGSDKAFDFEVLLECFKEHFDFPAVLVNVGDGRRPELEMISQKYQGLLAWNVEHDSAKEQIAAIFATPLAVEANDLILKDIAILWNRTVLDDTPIEVSPQAGDKENTGIAPLGEQVVVDVAQIHDHDRARS